MAILYLVAASLLSLWCGSVSMPSVKPQFPEPEQSHKAEIVFIGDVMCHTSQRLKAQSVNGYDFKRSFKYVKPIFQGADLVVANLETPISDRPPYSGYPTFNSPSELAEAMADAGVDVAITANNHALDMGTEGLKATLAALDKCGMKSAGTYSGSEDYARRTPLLIERGGIKFALLAYTYGTNGIKPCNGVVVPELDTLKMAADLERCNGADCTIAFLHWGDEYAATANATQRKIADFLHRRGCQIVVGSHPHTVQQAECTKREVTIYSLGNFVSNQRFRYSDGGIMAQVEVTKDSDGCSFCLNIIPVWVRQSDYAVIPKNIGDTIALNPEEGAAYNLFMEDTVKKFH